MNERAIDAERELTPEELIERDQLVYEMERGDLARRQLAVELLYLRELLAACRAHRRRLPPAVDVLVHRLPNLQLAHIRARLASQRPKLELTP